MPWLRHFALFLVFVTALFGPAAADAFVSAPDAGSRACVGAFELAAATLVGSASHATCGLHEGIGASYDENASGYRFAAGGTTRAASAAQGALLRAQLAAEEVAGARLPQAITGYTRHGLNQAISRDGVGVSTRAILDAFKNPLSITGQSGGTFMMTGRDAVVVVSAEGQVVTTWATNAAGVRVVP